MQIKYGIYLTVENTTIRFPVNPEEPTIEYPENNEKYNLLSVGEVVQPRKSGLAKISWDGGLLPGNSDAAYVLTSGDFKPPEYYISFLTRCKIEKLVGTLTIDRHLVDGTAFHSDTFTVVVGDFKISEKAAETGDFYYDIEFSEYRNFLPQNVTIEKKTSRTSAVTTGTRANNSKKLVVGAKVRVIGIYCANAAGGKPHKRGTGFTAKVGRIDRKRSYPILIRNLSGMAVGWCRKDAVSVL